MIIACDSFHMEINWSTEVYSYSHPGIQVSFETPGRLQAKEIEIDTETKSIVSGMHYFEFYAEAFLIAFNILEYNQKLTLLLPTAAAGALEKLKETEVVTDIKSSQMYTLNGGVKGLAQTVEYKKEDTLYVFKNFIFIHKNTLLNLLTSYHSDCIIDKQISDRFLKSIKLSVL